jgi:calcium/calmodulin-dependent protein kinase I
MMKNMTWKEALLPQPPSFGKKRNYEIKDVLGEGAFGKVVVCFSSNRNRLVC